MASIKLIVGLGNPGPQYESTRHNAGFWMVGSLARRMDASFRNEKGFFGLVAKAGAAWLLMPQTYMNRSGQAVLALANFYKILPDEILVVHDELDLQPGQVKMKLGGGNAGHNGLKDIAARLGTPEFWRLRIGIGHPRSLNIEQEVVDFVLHSPRKDEEELIDQAIDKALDAIPQVLSGEFERAMMQLHSKS
jgi:PTH1 family peptidyl-tRNA hydrolase